jgi:LysR family transcriptional regulator, carnitine catabolism transcriptional activator
MIQGLRHIRGFLAVARLGSFTRAAAELHVSQPALTVQIRQLEESLGVALFDRNKRQVHLTPAGRSLLAPLERVLVDMEAAIGVGHDLAGLRRGTVAIATLPSVAAGLLPTALRRFAAAWPGITVQVHDVVAETVVRRVKAEAVDFGIGSRIRADREIEVADLLTDRMCAFVPDDHPLAATRSPSLREVAAYPLILTHRDSSVRHLVERALEREELAFTLACEANYMSTAVGMVRGGLGVSILPESAVEAASCAGIAVRPIRTAGLTRRIGILTRAGRSLSPAAAAFVAVLREVVGGET